MAKENVIYTYICMCVCVCVCVFVCVCVCVIRSWLDLWILTRNVYESFFLSIIMALYVPLFPQGQRSPKLLWKGLDKYFSLWESFGPCHNCSTMPLYHKCSHGEYINYEHACVLIKLYLQIRVWRFLPLCLVSLLDPCSRPPVGSSFSVLDSCRTPTISGPLIMPKSWYVS